MASGKLLNFSGFQLCDNKDIGLDNVKSSFLLEHFIILNFPNSWGVNERPLRTYFSFRKHQTLGAIELTDKWHIYKILMNLDCSLAPTALTCMFLLSLTFCRAFLLKLWIKKEKIFLFIILYFLLWYSNYCCHLKLL